MTYVDLESSTVKSSTDPSELPVDLAELAARVEHA